MVMDLTSLFEKTQKMSHDSEEKTEKTKESEKDLWWFDYLAKVIATMIFCAIIVSFVTFVTFVIALCWAMMSVTWTEVTGWFF